MSEHVLVVPTAIFHKIGLFQGLCDDVSRYLPTLLDRQHLRFVPRDLAETDPSLKQIIPYVVLKHGDDVFQYQRGVGGGERRLHAKWSVGLGGHINPIDDAPEGDLYRRAMERELREEVELAAESREVAMGLINDDSSAVGQVHLGVVHVLELSAPAVRRREQVIHDSGFTSLSSLFSRRSEFETWSQFVLDWLA